jgi:hypothetical protein
MTKKRMDFYIRSVVTADLFWQQLTHSIIDFKPTRNVYVIEVPKGTNLVCFHGKPRIFQAENIEWIKEYINKQYQHERVA